MTPEQLIRIFCSHADTVRFLADPAMGRLECSFIPSYCTDIHAVVIGVEEENKQALRQEIATIFGNVQIEFKKPMSFGVEPAIFSELMKAAVRARQNVQ